MFLLHAACFAVECKDESSGDSYFFNQVTGESVWERDEVPGIGQ